MNKEKERKAKKKEQKHLRLEGACVQERDRAIWEGGGGERERGERER